MMKNKNHWSVDKRIPLAIIIMVFMQLAGAIIWATEINARVDNMQNQSMNGSTANEKFTRIEERLDYLKENVDAIKRHLERLTERALRK